MSVSVVWYSRACVRHAAHNRYAITAQVEGATLFPVPSFNEYHKVRGREDGGWGKLAILCSQACGAFCPRLGVARSLRAAVPPVRCGALVEICLYVLCFQAALAAGMAVRGELQSRHHAVPLTYYPRAHAQDYQELVRMIHTPLVKTYAYRRLELAAARFQLHQQLNADKEMAESKAVPHRDFYNVR